MFIDMTLWPMGPAIPFIVSSKNVEEACKEVNSMYTEPRTMRVYQLTEFDGPLNLLIMYETGKPLNEDFLQGWYERNAVDKPERVRVRRAR